MFNAALACGEPEAGKQCGSGETEAGGSKPGKVWGPRQHSIFLGLTMLEPSTEGSLCDSRNHMLGKGQRTELGNLRRHQTQAGKACRKATCKTGDRACL